MVNNLLSSTSKWEFLQSIVNVLLHDSFSNLFLLSPKNRQPLSWPLVFNHCCYNGSLVFLSGYLSPAHCFSFGGAGPVPQGLDFEWGPKFWKTVRCPNCITHCPVCVTWNVLWMCEGKGQDHNQWLVWAIRPLRLYKRHIMCTQSWSPCGW